MRVLLIEDNVRLAGFIGKALGAAGFTTDHCDCAGDGEAALDTVRYDALVLDLGLPDDDGMNVLRRVRMHVAELPVLILTARDGVEDRVGGLNAGADDYLLKPFAMEELIARLNALMRRPGTTLGRELTIANLTFDSVGREVTVDDKVMPLTRREMSVLELLLRRAGRVVPKDVLADSVYGFDENFGANSIEVAVHRLRKRLQDSGARLEIHTLRGIGYMLVEPGDGLKKAAS
jgi:DNA-binding response OmpR family regulator